MNQAQNLGVKFDREDLDDTQEEVHADTSLRALLCDDKSRLINLLIMVFNWSVCSFCFYVIGFFIKYFRGSMYTNAMMMGTADIIAAISVRIAQMYISTKRGFIIAYLWVFIVTVFYLLFESIESLIPICIL